MHGRGILDDNPGEESMDRSIHPLESTHYMGQHMGNKDSPADACRVSDRSIYDHHIVDGEVGVVEAHGCQNYLQKMPRKSYLSTAAQNLSEDHNEVHRSMPG